MPEIEHREQDMELNSAKSVELVLTLKDGVRLHFGVDQLDEGTLNRKFDIEEDDKFYPLGEDVDFYIMGASRVTNMEMNLHVKGKRMSMKVIE